MRLRSRRWRMKKMQWIICLPVALASACFVLYTSSFSSSTFSSSSSSSSSPSSSYKSERDREKQSDVNKAPVTKATTSTNRLKMSPMKQEEGKRTEAGRTRMMPKRLSPSPLSTSSSSSSSSSSSAQLNNPRAFGSQGHRVVLPDRYGHYSSRHTKAKTPNIALGQMKFSRQQTFVGVERSRSGIIVSAAVDATVAAAAAAGDGDRVRAHSVNEPNSVVAAPVEGKGKGDGGKTTDDNGSIQLASTAYEIASRNAPPPIPPRSPPQPTTPLWSPLSVAPKNQGDNHMPTDEREWEEDMTEASKHSLSVSPSAKSSSISFLNSSYSSPDSSSSSSPGTNGDLTVDVNLRDYGRREARTVKQEGAEERRGEEGEWENSGSKEAYGRLRDGKGNDKSFERRLEDSVVRLKIRSNSHRGNRTKRTTSTPDNRTIHRTKSPDRCPDDASRKRSKTNSEVAAAASQAGQVTCVESTRGATPQPLRLNRSSTEVEKDSAVIWALQKRVAADVQESTGGEGGVGSGRAMTIPRIIHQTSDHATVPGQVVEWIKSWLRNNPQYEHWFWTDSGTRHVLSEHYPPWIADLYDAYPYAINQADIRKFLILYLHGGVYADLDTECLRPLDSLFDQPEAGCILGLEPEIHRLFLYPNDDGRDYVTSSFIACRPRHPFLDFVIQQLPDYFDNSRTLAWNDNILNSTGPTFLTEVVHKYLSDGRGQGPEAGIFIAPSEWLVPTFDPINLDRFKVLCKVKGIASRDFRGVIPLPKICDKLASNAFLNVPEAQSYTNHHWLHSWGINFIPHGFTPVETLTNLTRLIV